MKKTPLLNSAISCAISEMGHGDMLCICDAGLPISQDVDRIDLALTQGIPSFLEVLDAVMTELEVEEVILAKEIEVDSNVLYEEIKIRFPKTCITLISHEELKVLSRECQSVIRTGEFTSYANIILKSGVVF